MFCLLSLASTNILADPNIASISSLYSNYFNNTHIAKIPPKKILGNFKNIYQTFILRNRAAKNQLPEPRDPRDPRNNALKHGIEYSDNESNRPKRVRRDSSISNKGFSGFSRLSNKEILDLGTNEIQDIQVSVSFPQLIYYFFILYLIYLYIPLGLLLYKYERLIYRIT